MSILLLWDIDGTLLLNKGVGSRAMTRAFHEVYGVENAFAGLGFAGGLDLHFFDAAFQKRACHGLRTSTIFWKPITAPCATSCVPAT